MAGVGDLSLTRIPETQMVDLVCVNRIRGIVRNLGPLREKLAIRQELEAHKMAQIRQGSMEAERARTARRTVTLDKCPSASSGSSGGGTVFERVCVAVAVAYLHWLKLGMSGGLRLMRRLDANGGRNGTLLTRILRDRRSSDRLKGRSSGELYASSAAGTADRPAPMGTIILPPSHFAAAAAATLPHHHRDSSGSGSNSHCSERDSSQHSWSPVLTEHAAGNPSEGLCGKMAKLVAASTGPSSVKDPATRRPAATTAAVAATIAVERKASATELLPGRLSVATEPGPPACHQLADEFGQRYGEYLALNEWVDRRLEVFRQIERDLADHGAVGKEPTAQQQVIFRLVVEEQRLKDDRDYWEKLEKLEECCASLIMIKARLKAARPSTLA